MESRISCNIHIGEKGARNINLELHVTITIMETDMTPANRPSGTQASHHQTSDRLHSSLTEKHCPHTGRKASETFAYVGV